MNVVLNFNGTTRTMLSRNLANDRVRRLNPWETNRQRKAR